MGGEGDESGFAREWKAGEQRVAAAHTQRHAGAGCTVLLSRTPAPSGGVPAYPKRLRGPFGGGRPGMVSDSAVAGQQGGMEGWRGEGMGGARQC